MFSINEWAILFVAALFLVVLPGAVMAAIVLASRRRRVDEPWERAGSANQPTTPVGWHADPTGRHEVRYWDGSWTEHVATGGVAGIDPTPPGYRSAEAAGALMRRNAGG